MINGIDRESINALWCISININVLNDERKAKEKWRETFNREKTYTASQSFTSDQWGTLSLIFSFSFSTMTIDLLDFYSGNPQLIGVQLSLMIDIKKASKRHWAAQLVTISLIDRFTDSFLV